jgi:hypothetical protein
MTLALRKMELHGRIGSGITGLAIERKISRRDLKSFLGGFSGLSGRHGSGKIDLDIPFADNVAARGLVVTFAGVDVVVSAAVMAVNRDPNILKESAVLVFILCGV